MTLLKTILVVLLLIFVLTINAAASNLTDLEALLDIKAKITSDPGGALQSWKKSVDFCQWAGVTCDYRHKRVTVINLTAKHLGGTLSPFVGNLSFLQELRLGNNSFTGNVPSKLGSLLELENLDLGHNGFEGEIPAHISLCSRLNNLTLASNKLVGRIPTELGRLTQLQKLSLDYNNLTGEISAVANLTSLQKLLLSGQTYQGVIGFRGNLPNFIAGFKNLFILALMGTARNSFSGRIPPSYYNLSNLQVFSLDENLLEGSLPPEIGLYFPHLRWLQMGSNQLTGSVPISMSNLSKLEVLDLAVNNFSGKFMLDAKNMPNLSLLGINSNNLGTQEADDLKFLDTLVNCSKLDILYIAVNYFGGSLPHSIANLSTTVRMMLFTNNQISGIIPTGLGKLLSLQLLFLDENQLNGIIPADIGNLPRLQQVYFSKNRLSGEIPTALGNISLLSDLSLSSNRLQGKVPASLGNCKNLQGLDLGKNNLVGELPPQLFKVSALIEIHVDNNYLQGSLPSEIGDTKNLVFLLLANNNFSGQIPASLGRCVSLTDLYLQKNSFAGPIPLSFSLLKDLQTIDLSHNQLSGQVPQYFSGFPSLAELNLSNNNFEAEVPTKGVFNNVTGVSLFGNSRLCGGIPEIGLPKCRITVKPKREKRISRALVVVITTSSALVGLAITLSSLYLLYTRKRHRTTLSSGSSIRGSFLKVSYDMLLRATNKFSPANMIGAGGFGSVHKGTLVHNGVEEIVAIKVMNNEHRGGRASFIAECDALRVIRHRNLVGIITACSTIDFQGNEFRALVYEFMPNGSLEKWLHSASEGGNLPSFSLFQRLNIAIDVAYALDYIHNQCGTPIIHCDLKPDNVLLDENMTAHVSDFGLAKLLPEVVEQLNSCSSSVGVRGTIGYAAPEYGLGSAVSAAGDVYSYGVIMLEMMTALRPTNAMFGEELNLHKLAQSAVPERLTEIIDPRLLLEDGEEPHNNLRARTAVHDWAIRCITTIVQIGVQCSSELPGDRMNIQDVISQLQSERDTFYRANRGRG